MSINKVFTILFVTLLITLTTGCGGQVSTTGAGGGTGVIHLSWDAPDKNTDGTPLDDLTGYKIYYGPSTNYYTNVIVINDKTTNYSLQNLLPGSYYIAITVYNASGNESGFSNEINISI